MSSSSESVGAASLDADVAHALDAARTAFASLSVPESARTDALANLQRWLTDPAFSSYRAQIMALVDHQRWAVLLDSFYQVLPFGTGGRRGTVGVGPNRFNPWTLGSSVQGHARWLRRTFGDRRLSVVVSYDVRVFQDARGQLVSGVANPVLGLSSRDFAEIAAEVYAAADIEVHLPPAGVYLSTPELSFAIRHLGADGGLIISASHNPPDDNGGKIYDAQGGQAVPPQDEEVAREVEGIVHVERMSLDRARAAGLIHEIDPAVHEAYIAANLACSLKPDARSARIVFTGLHGLGRQTAGEVLERAGFDVSIEPTQASYDGAFPNVPFRAPNPEVPRSMSAACAHADKVGADIVMSCDPDADRLGLMVRHPLSRGGAGGASSWRFFSGNEIAAIACDYIITHGGRPHPLVIQTEVTSRLLSRVARSRGARVIDHLLVGFKYIGDALHQIEQHGEFAGISARLEDFALGAEESHGLLVTPAIRDKDAAGAALVIAELASIEKDQGRSLVDTLDGLWRRVGYVKNLLKSAVMMGAEGRARIEAIMARFRIDPPHRIGGRAVTAFHDRRDEDGVFGPIKSGTDRASRNVLVWELGEDARVVLRPSGTEPKAKVYVEVAGTRGAELATEIPRVDAEAARLAEEFVLLMLRAVDIDLPPWALKTSDLVAIEHKLDFAVEVLPTLAERLASDEDPATVEQWLDRRIAAYGRDARQLVADAVRAWVRQERPASAAAVLALFEG
ncbi:MAG: phospho-sugar mutase [Deltaproteobacteria bacterium]|nr:MAG: phospho-sugar mutase [Deltaproteobacteria bacterium]